MCTFFERTITLLHMPSMYDGALRYGSNGTGDVWTTPVDLFAALNARFMFTLDAAADDDNALCARYYTPAVDGLIQGWVVWERAEGSMCLCRCHLIAGKSAAPGNVDALSAKGGSARTPTTSRASSGRRAGSTSTAFAESVAGLMPANACENSGAALLPPNVSAMLATGTGPLHKARNGDGSVTSSTTQFDGSGSPESHTPSLQSSGELRANSSVTDVPTVGKGLNSSNLTTLSQSARPNFPARSQETQSPRAHRATEARDQRARDSGGQTWISCQQCAGCYPCTSRTFVNPPYSTVRKWTGKAAAEYECGNADLVCMLVPVRTSTVWWREATGAGARAVFLPERLYFGHANYSGRAGFDSALLLWGCGSLYVSRCSWCRDWMTSSRSHARTCSNRCHVARNRS